MRLKSIKLAGFKSFVDPTTVSFPHNMTAIVGPNGCGKSNVIDAVRWVMGESSAKNLRGESMTDVIFNGSSARQPVGQASIELIFDNSSGKLAGEYAAFNEISIRRKVTREGQSQYYLNGSKCRRRDVTDIFLGTGMGPRSYAIIEQGMISRLIESKPEELRVYLEEAAGISKYKERRRETENRIARTQENLDRLSDVREELGKQLAHLQRQAKAAERFKEYKQEERDCNAKLNAFRWRSLDVTSSKLGRDISATETDIEKLVLSRTENETKIESLRLELEHKQDELTQAQSKYFESGTDVAKLEQDIKYRKEKAQERTSALAKLALERASIGERIKDTQQQLSVAEEQTADIAPELESLNEQLDEVNELLAEGAHELERWQADWELFETSYQQSVRERESARDGLNRLDKSILEKQNRFRTLEDERRELAEQLEGTGGQELSMELARVSETLNLETERVQEASAKQETARSALETFREQHQNLSAELSKKQAVLASLRTLQESAIKREGGDEALQDLLTGSGIDPERRVFTQLKIEDTWSKAVEHVLSEFLMAIYCDDAVLSPDLSESIEHALVLVDGGSDGNEAASIPSSETDRADCLLSKVKGAEPFSALLNQVLVADSVAQAQSMRESLAPGQSIITPDGTWVSPSWVKYYRPSAESTGLVQREQQIKQLLVEIDALTDQVRDVSAGIEAHQGTLGELDESVRAGTVLIKELSAEDSKLRAEKSAMDARNEQRQIRLTRADEELAELKEALDEELESQAMLREQQEEALFRLESNADERERRIEEKRSMQSKNESRGQEARRLQLELHAMQLRQQEGLSQKKLLEMTEARLQEDLNRVTSEHEDILASQEQTEDLGDLELKLEGLLERRLAMEAKLNEARQAMEMRAKTLKEVEQDRGLCEEQVQAQRSVLESLRMEKQAMDIKQAGLKQSVEEDSYEFESVIGQLEPEDTENAFVQALEKLAQKIQRLGAINLAAVDEYKEQSERKSYLDAQDAELVEALETLMAAIRKIDKETRARFKETYDLVNEGLQRLFPKIFGGGSAKLALTDDDLLETGVSILARPPGKKNSTIHLLSGGEKALTAIALVFAIFELNPAPFCMLDEVDAPLDDANVGRFANIVKEMSDRVQFIYISHNKVSMEKADQLMGVTMSEPGCSRLVSVDVDEAVSLAEA